MKTTRFRYALAAVGVAAVTSVAAVGGAAASATEAAADKNIVQTTGERGSVHDADRPRQAGGPRRTALRLRQAHRVRPDGQGLRKGAEGDPSKAAAQRAAAQSAYVVKGDVKAAAGREAAPGSGDAERRFRPDRRQGATRLPEPHDTRREDEHQRLERHDPRHRRRPDSADELAGGAAAKGTLVAAGRGAFVLSRLP